MKSPPLLPLCLAALAIVPAAKATTEKYRLIWNTTPESSITIGWCQVDGDGAEVRYRESDAAADAPTQTHGIDHETTHHKLENKFARLTGLKPDTVYDFIIKDSNSSSKPFNFKTAPAGDAKFSFCAGGDSRNHRDARQNANRTVAKLRPLFVCFGGDMINRSTPDEWADWLDDWQLTTGEDGRMVPIIATRGNHEGSKDIHLLFDTPDADDYYAVGFGDGFLRVYTLNSNITRDGSQGEWLGEDLAANEDTRWKVAQYHHPFRPHTSGKREQHAQYNAWAPLFYEHGVDLAIECDSHTVKRTWPLRPSNEPGSDEGFIRDDENGITFVGEGCWGAPLRANNDDKEWTRDSGRFNQINWVCVAPQQMLIRTIKVDSIDSTSGPRPENPFALPEGLEIWEPENGAAVSLTPRGAGAIAASSLARVKVIASETSFADHTIVRIETDGELPEGAEIRFTTGGAEPTATSYLYEKPFKLSASAKVRAAVFADGKPVTKSVVLELTRTAAE